MAPTCFEDVELGVTRPADGEFEVTREEIVAFAGRWDPQPFHLDEAAGAESVLGGLTACFAHVFAIQSRLASQQQDQLALLAGLGFEEARMTRPVRPGDCLRLEVEHVEKRESRSKPDRGIVSSVFTLMNQRGERVMTMRGRAMVARRGA
jgi:acyl dehydratase